MPIDITPAGPRANAAALVSDWYDWAYGNGKGSIPPSRLRSVHGAMGAVPPIFRQALDARHRRGGYRHDSDAAERAGFSLSAYRRRIAMAYAFVDGFCVGYGTRKEPIPGRSVVCS